MKIATTLQEPLPDGAFARLGKGYILGMQYSLDGTWLAVACSIGIWLYDTEAHQEGVLLTGHMEKVTSVAFSPNGNTLASGSDDGTVLLWKIAKVALAASDRFGDDRTVLLWKITQILHMLTLVR